MRKLNETERKAFVEKVAKERGELQAKINQLNAEREKYVARQMKAQSGGNTLDTAVISAIREQGQKRNFQFE
jgi:chorismate mutase